MKRNKLQGFVIIDALIAISIISLLTLLLSNTMKICIAFQNHKISHTIQMNEHYDYNLKNIYLETTLLEIPEECEEAEEELAKVSY